jgi:CHAT domain-containing protein/Flp pilus assembly protein TadD
MSLTSAELSTRLAELNAYLRPDTIAEEHPELCVSDVILRIVDEVNRVARQDLARAEHLANIASWLADAIDDDFCRARAARSIANTKVLRGRHAEALEDLARALKLFRDLGAEIEQAATLSASLQPLIYQGNYAQALERADEAKDIATRHGDELLLGRLEINFGNILHRQDRFRDAIDHYQLGLEKLTRLEQPRDCAIGLINLAVCYISLHDFRQAERAYQSARDISIRENMVTIVAQADYNIAYLHYYRSEYKQAIELYQKTRLYCQSVNDGYHSALCDLDQAEMYLDLHLHEEGVRLAQNALSAFEKTGMSYEATKAIVLLGIGLYQSEKPFEALEVFARAQDRMRTEANTAWVAKLDLYQGLVLQQEGRYYEAIRHCRRAQESLGTVPTFLLADTHLLMAGLYLDLEQFVDAESWADTAMETAQTLESHLHLSRAWWLIGRLAEMFGTTGEARSSYQRALENQRAIPLQLQIGGSKISYAKNRSEIYEAVVSLELVESASPNAEKVFELNEQARAREIAELLAFRTNALPTPSRNRSALVEQVNKLREDLSWYYRKASTAEVGVPRSLADTEELRSIVREQENSLVKTLSELQTTEEEFHSLMSARTISGDQIRERLADNEVIVQFFIVRGLISACLLERDSLQIVPLARLGTVRQQLRELRVEFNNVALVDQPSRHFAESHLKRTLTTLEALHEALIGPLVDRLERRRLVIVPEGPLHYLPFHALFDGERFLFEKHVVSYAGSASMHYFDSLRSTCSGGDFFIGEASHADQLSPQSFDCLTLGAEFARLPSVQALESRQKQSRFIHLACGVQFRRDNVLFSTLSLGTTEMSFLDTFHLRLPCDVLGLTGSGTGVRTNDYGRELLSLARGLEYAGARAVLMPLWNAHHHPTRKFLDLFYQGAASKADRGTVFQSALAEVREHYPHPYHWASFTLRGKIWGPIPNQTTYPSVAAAGQTASSSKEIRTKMA